MARERVIPQPRLGQFAEGCDDLLGVVVAEVTSGGVGGAGDAVDRGEFCSVVVLGALLPELREHLAARPPGHRRAWSVRVTEHHNIGADRLLEA